MLVWFSSRFHLKSILQRDHHDIPWRNNIFAEDTDISGLPNYLRRIYWSRNKVGLFTSFAIVAFLQIHIRNDREESVNSDNIPHRNHAKLWVLLKMSEFVSYCSIFAHGSEGFRPNSSLIIWASWSLAAYGIPLFCIADFRSILGSYSTRLLHSDICDGKLKFLKSDEFKWALTFI